MSLADYAKIYKEVTAAYESNYMDPKPGVYKCRVAKGEYRNIIKESTDYDKFTWVLKIIEGDYTGQQFQKVEFLPKDPEKASIQMAYIKGAIERCGVHPPANILDLPLAMAKCCGAELEVSVVETNISSKEGKKIKNIKFTKQLAIQATANDNDGTNNFSQPGEMPNDIPF